ncbi:unnamed protein product [Anisakis simplex]|uniref:Ovule protein n=1 Tax=Anisakis simplex TaxID=6269 RepID=A0A0M3JDU4_ANISI|nr:unnamed protein product [Anisakis simplex]
MGNKSSSHQPPAYRSQQHNYHYPPPHLNPIRLPMPPPNAQHPLYPGPPPYNHPNQFIRSSQQFHHQSMTSLHHPSNAAAAAATDSGYMTSPSENAERWKAQQVCVCVCLCSFLSVYQFDVLPLPLHIVLNTLLTHSLVFARFSFLRQNTHFDKFHFLMKTFECASII